MKNEELKDKINKIGDTRWKEKVDSMSNLSLYKTKMKMQEEDIYDNSFNSVLMSIQYYQARLEDSLGRRRIRL